MPRSNKKRTGLGKGLGALIHKEPVIENEIDLDVAEGTSESEGRQRKVSKGVHIEVSEEASKNTVVVGTSRRAKMANFKTNNKKAESSTKDNSQKQSDDEAEYTSQKKSTDSELHTSSKGTEGNTGVKVEGEAKLEGSVLIPVDKVIPNPNQPRKNFAEDDMTSLMDSIKRIGVIQPIIVCKAGDVYNLVAGERRLRASKAVGLEMIPALIKDYSSEEVTEVALVENLQRQNLDPIEEAFAYQRLMDTFKQTQDTIANRLGRSRSYIANIVRLLNLPDFVRNDLSAGELTIGQARPLLALSEEAQQREIWNIIKEKDLNARQIEALVKRVKEGKELEPRKQPSTLHNTAELRDLVERIKLSVGVKAAIKLKPGKKVQGRIELPFKSEEELTRLIEYMESQEHSIGANKIQDEDSLSETIEFKV